VRRFAWLAAVFLLIGAPAAAAREEQADLADISDEVMCVVCGVPLELAQEAPQAEAERNFIRKLIAAGETKDEIKDALVAEYGEQVLAVPGDEGFDLAAWVVPGLAFLLAAGGIALALHRWRGDSGDADPPESGPEPRAEDAERLEADMARYEL
jgi:cytochrome c-type biogenesis protein CcmH/NrfF